MLVFDPSPHSKNPEEGLFRAFFWSSSCWCIVSFGALLSLVFGCVRRPTLQESVLAMDQRLTEEDLERIESRASFTPERAHPERLGALLSSPGTPTIRGKMKGWVDGRWFISGVQGCHKSIFPPMATCFCREILNFSPIFLGGFELHVLGWKGILFEYCAAFPPHLQFFSLSSPKRTNYFRFFLNFQNHPQRGSLRGDLCI